MDCRRLAAALRGRRAEIERMMLTRVQAISGPGERSDPEYLDGLRLAVSAAIGYGIEAIENEDDREIAVPNEMLSQARLAARHGVPLATVLRRYLAGHILLDGFLVEEAERDQQLTGASLQRLLRGQGALVDRLIATVTEEYGRESQERVGLPEERLVRRVEGLLDGRLLDTSTLGYDFGTSHVGTVVNAPMAANAARQAAKVLDRLCLVVPRGGESIWAWFGGRRPLDPDRLGSVLLERLPAASTVAIGEAAAGMEGWRLSNLQARAAMPIALRRPGRAVRFGSVALLASTQQDDLLATSLRRLYLDPLEGERGASLRETLRAYFAAERNISSTAARLGVNRKTVVSRLQTVEQSLGRRLSDCGAEIETALRLQDLAPEPAAVVNSKA